MATPFLLDTNAYYRFFQDPKRRNSTENDTYNRLLQKVTVRTMKSFYISEITSMEIHSVLGKYRRGIQSQQQKCVREIIVAGKAERCDHTWITRGMRQKPLKWFQDMQKMTADIEAQRGGLQATVLDLDKASIQAARDLLMQYAALHNLGSHDALIAGSLLAKKKDGLNLTLITSDKDLKKVLKKADIGFYDPLNP